MRNIGLVLIWFISFQVSKAQTTHHGIDPNWYQTPKAAVSSASNNLAGSVANNMVVKSNGTVIIFYRQSGQNKWIQSTDSGNNWTSPGTLYAPAAIGLSTITADIDQSDNIYIAWKSGDFTLGFAMYNGSSWVNTNTISTQTQTGSDTVQFSQISVDRNNRIHIMWQQGNHQNYTMGIKSTCWYAQSNDMGVNFNTTLLSSDNNYHAAFPVADFNGTSSDTLLIAWREKMNAGTNFSNWNWDVKAKITYDGGITWNPTFTLEGNTVPGDDDQWDPNIIVDKNGVIHAFYHVYHDNTMPDYNANIMYEYSLDGGNTWSSPMQLSTTNIRSHLIKTAYDYSNNYVWCTWKDEMDFGNLMSGNPQADLKTVYIQNTGTPIISSQEFITDHDSFELALHNFKVGNDGIMRATYNKSKQAGKGDTIFYTQRATFNTGMEESQTSIIHAWPNPTHDFIYLNIHDQNIDSITLYNSQGMVVWVWNKMDDRVQLPSSGLYFIEILKGHVKQVEKVIKW